MLFKKLFGKKTTEAPATSKAVEANLTPTLPSPLPDGWIGIAYPTRQGYQTAEIQSDPRYANPALRNGLDLCVRVILNLDPQFCQPNGLPLASFRQTLVEMEKALMARLAAHGISKIVLVAKLAYEGVYEWVFQGYFTEGTLLEAFLKWKEKWPAHLLELCTAAGWEYYESYLQPSPAETQAGIDRQLVAELLAMGTEPEAYHRLVHKFSGHPTQLLVLRDQLFKDDFRIVQEPGTELHALKSMQLDAKAISETTAKLHGMAREAGATYLGWKAEPIKEQLLAGSTQEGYGKYMFKNGGVYEGEWRNQLRHGKGTMYFANGDIYVGDWLNNDRTGTGRLNWGNSEWYEGEFHANQIHGQGILHYASGTVYEGQWVNGNRHGRGKLLWADGSVYVGDWSDNKRTGFGRLVYTNPEEWYEGGFLDNQLHGAGKDFMSAEKRIREGRWDNGQIIVDKDPKVQPAATGKGIALHWEVAPTGGDGLENLLAAHARRVIEGHQLPCIFIQRAADSPAKHLYHYHTLPEFAHVFEKIAVIEVPAADFSAELARLGFPDNAYLVRLDMYGKPKGNPITAPFWYTEFTAAAAARLEEFLS